MGWLPTCLGTLLDSLEWIFGTYKLFLTCFLSSMLSMQLTQHLHWGNCCILFTLGNRCTSCYATHTTYVACQRDFWSVSNIVSELAMKNSIHLWNWQWWWVDATICFWLWWKILFTDSIGDMAFLQTKNLYMKSYWQWHINFERIFLGKIWTFLSLSLWVK